MKSIKPGRGPSMMGGIVSLLMGVFGILWTIVVASIGGGLFALFGLVFIAIAIVQAVYNFKNATSENRYSSFDITESGEEEDPLNQRFHGDRFSGENPPRENTSPKSRFCPYCGAPAQGDYSYCNCCGKKLP